MRKPLVAGNWKMHGSRADSAALVRSLLDRLPVSVAHLLCRGMAMSCTVAKK